MCGQAVPLAGSPARGGLACSSSCRHRHAARPALGQVASDVCRLPLRLPLRGRWGAQALATCHPLLFSLAAGRLWQQRSQRADACTLALRKCRLCRPCRQPSLLAARLARLSGRPSRAPAGLSGAGEQLLPPGGLQLR